MYIKNKNKSFTLLLILIIIFIIIIDCNYTFINLISGTTILYYIFVLSMYFLLDYVNDNIYTKK